jgi:hypothetical protein
MTAADRARAGRPKVLPPIEDTLRVAPPRTYLVSEHGTYDALVQRGIAVKGWVFAAVEVAAEAGSFAIDYEWAYELDGAVCTGQRRLDTDGYEWRMFGGHYRDWFMDVVMKCQPATVIVDPQTREARLFGDLSPYEVLTLATQVARADQASRARRAKEIEYAVDVLHENLGGHAAQIGKLLAPYTASYTTRGADPFYAVADLYKHLRDGGDVMRILRTVALALPELSKRYWAAE